MNNLEYKYYPGEEVNFLNPQGKLMTDIVDKVEINIGATFARTSTWVETAKKLETTINYRLRNTPASYLIPEENLFKVKKEEVVSE